MDNVKIEKGKYCLIHAFLPEQFERWLDRITELSCEHEWQYDTRETALWFAVEELYQRLEREHKEVQEEKRLRAEASQARMNALKKMPYKEYLRTPEWLSFRATILKERGSKCELCGDTGTTINVHHRTYRSRGHESAEDVIVLCQPCHELFHKNGKLAESGK